MPIIHNLADSILDIEISRPEKRNSLDRDMLDSLAELFIAADRDDAVRAVFLHAQPGIFSAGEDIAHGDDAAADRMLSALVACSKPVVACVEGPAVGLAVAMLYACDLVYASDSALFSLPFTALGLTPRYGVTLLAAQNGGIRKAAQKLLLSEPISANEAFAMNLVNGVFPADQVRKQSAGRAIRLAGLSPVAVQQTKSVLRAVLARQLEDVRQIEDEAHARASASPYAKEARAAFLEGRKPDFSKASEE
jgi:enoyl-CoA hydratase/carnithine racemase